MANADAHGVFQFGGGTVIPPDVALLIFDCYETLIELDGRAYIPRKGVLDFLDRYSTIPLAIISDGEHGTVAASLIQAGIADRFAVVWGAPESLATLPDGRVLKRLDVVLQHFKIDRDRAVFIGDSPLDAEAARFHLVPFIRIPRSEDRDFSFARLLKGPSRYQSSEFTAIFLERYMQRKGK